MLLSLVVQIKPFKVGTLPPFSGPALHGVFFSWLKSVNPMLAAELHNAKSAKPFTVSNLQTGDGAEAPALFMPTREIVLDTNKTYWFRLTSLDKRLSELLLERFYKQPPLSLEVFKHFFRVEKVIAEQSEHPWAGSSSWQELAQANFFADTASTSSSSRVKLIFFSPTTFKARERFFPVPMPAQTFISLAARWNSFSPVPLDPSFGAFLDESVAINAYNLQTELVTMEGAKRGAKMVCFRGWCEYASFERESEWNAALKMLAQFAFFAGVGYKTTMGFGQTLFAH